MSKELVLGVVIGASLKAGFATAFGRAEKSAQALGNEIKSATKHHEQFGRSIRARLALNPTQNLAKEARAYANMGMAINRATIAQDKLNQAIAKQHSAQEFRKNLRAGMAETAGHAAVVATPVIGAVKKFMEQENASADLKISMMQKDGSFGKFEQIDKLATEWGAALPGNKTDFTQMALGLKSQGISDDTIINGGGLATAQLNTVMGIPIADGSFFAKNMEAHGIKESEMLASADLTQRAYFAAGLTKDDMFQAMSYYAPKANTLGLTGLENQKQIYAIEGLAANKGLEGSSFGTNFSMMLSQLSNGPKMITEAKRGMKAEVRDMLESSGAQFEFFNQDGTMKSMRDITGILETGFAKIRTKFGDQGVMDAADALFGQEGGRVAAIMGQAGLAGFDAMTAKMDNQASLQDRIKVKTDTLSSAIEALGGVAENTAAKFGGIFAEDIKSFANTAQSLIENWIVPFVENNKGLIKVAFGVAIGLFAIKLGAFGIAYAFSMLMMPVRSLAVALGKLRAARAIFGLMRAGNLSRSVAMFRMFGLSAQKSAAAAKWLNVALLPLNKAFAVFSKVPGVQMLGRGLIWLKNIAVFVGRSLLTTFPGLLVLAGIAILIYKYWKPLKAFFAGLWDGLKQGLAPLAPLWDGFVSIFSGLWARIQPFVQPVIDWFTDFFSITQVAEGGARSFGESIGLWIGEKIAAVAGWVVGKIEEIKTAFDGGLLGILDLIVRWSPIIAFKNAFAAVLGWFGVELPASFTTFGDNLISGLWNGIKAKWEALKAWWRGESSLLGVIFVQKNEIKSPSRLFKRFGGFITEGLAIGLNKGADKPLNAVGNMAGNLQQRFTNRAGELRSNLSAEMAARSGEFAAARRETAVPQQAVNIHFNPTIHAPGGDAQQIQAALQMSLREFEELYRRMMDNTARRAY